VKPRESSRLPFWAVVLSGGEREDQLKGLSVRWWSTAFSLTRAGEFEKRFIKRVLDRVDGNRSRAADVLGIHRIR